MAVANGFGKVVTSGSVFMYDTGDTVNSYLGEPTTNLYTTLGFGFYQQEGNHTAARTVGPAPNLNLPSNYDYTTITTTGNWQAEVNRIIIWTNSSLSTGTYNISFWARVTSTTTATMGCAFYGNNINHTISLTNQWQRFSIQSTTNPTYRATEFGSLSGAITFQIAGLQIESISHAAQYVNGVRSATQGLLPLVGNSTINLSTVSFDSNAQMTFDGTDDKIDVSYYSQVNNSLSRSWEVIVRPTTNLSYAGIFGNKLGYGCSFYCNGGIYLWDGNWVFNWYDNSSYQFLYSYSPPSVNSYTHIVGTYDATDQKPRIYVNGELKATYGSSTNMNYGGETYVIDIGWNSKDGGLHYFQGQIPITKYYQGKALSASEVQQNYNKYKTRFNLS